MSIIAVLCYLYDIVLDEGRHDKVYTTVHFCNELVLRSSLKSKPISLRRFFLVSRSESLALALWLPSLDSSTVTFSQSAPALLLPVLPGVVAALTSSSSSSFWTSGSLCAVGVVAVGSVGWAAEAFPLPFPWDSVVRFSGFALAPSSGAPSTRSSMMVCTCCHTCGPNKKEGPAHP